MPKSYARFNRPATTERLCAALCQHFSLADLKLEIEMGDTQGQTLAEIEIRQAEARQAEAESALENDDNIHEFTRRFGATVREGSVRPTDPASVSQSSPEIH